MLTGFVMILVIGLVAIRLGARFVWSLSWHEGGSFHAFVIHLLIPNFEILKHSNDVSLDKIKHWIHTAHKLYTNAHYIVHGIHCTLHYVQ